MIRKAYLMTLRPGQQQEYERRHNPIWPELEELLRDYGVWGYSIYLNRDTDQLFAYVEVESEERWQQIAQTEVCQKWWAEMKALTFSHDDNSPVIINLDEVFHLD
jgi:L-rhamnose mutarotase